MHDPTACPMCGQPLSEDATLERLCGVCRMAIDPTSAHFAIAGGAGLSFYCSPGCLRASIAITSATRDRTSAGLAT